MSLEKLVAWAHGHAGRFMPMGQGVYVALTGQLRARLRDLAGVGDAMRDGIRVPRWWPRPWLDDVLAGAGVDPDARLRTRVRRLRAAREADAAVPATLATELRPYQEEGYRWMMALAEAGFGACLADDMGLGKTLQSLALLLARAADGAALVVAPTSVCGNWAAEARRFAPTLNVHLYAEGDRVAIVEQAGAHDLVIVSYQLLQQARKDFGARRWHTVIADEAQSIKNPSSRRAQAMFALAADCRVALSGTPIENRLSELWAVMRFCNPGLLGSLVRFNEHFANPIERNGAREPRVRLRRMIAPFVLRRTKAQVLDELPPRTELVIRVEPEPAEAAHYEALRRQALSEAERALLRPPARKGRKAQPAAPAEPDARIHVLAQLMRMRRAACDPRLATPEVAAPGAKVRAFAELAATLAANGHKTLVFSQFVDFLQLMRRALDEAGLAYQYLDGATPAGERTRRVAAFQGGAGDVFLISLKAGGFGLNLTAADYIVTARPLVESRRRGSGDGPRAPHRPAAAGHGLPADYRRDHRGTDRGPPPRQARPGGRRARRHRRRSHGPRRRLARHRRTGRPAAALISSRTKRYTKALPMMVQRTRARMRPSPKSRILPCCGANHLGTNTAL